MRIQTKMIAGIVFAASAAINAPAVATVVPNGTVTIAAVFSPTVDLTATPATYTATLGNTFQVVGNGGFTGVTGLPGQMNGTLSFSSTVGQTLTQSLGNFFVFDDGANGTYNFSVDSVRTAAYAANAGVSDSFSLFLLGTTLDSAKGLSATPTSLTLSFNSTGGSPYGASATLAVPPGAGSVPEPASWALMLVGFGAIGTTLRARRSASVTFA